MNASIEAEYADRSRTLLCETVHHRFTSATPVVLVIGDFRSRDAFVWKAWERICADYGESDSPVSIRLREPIQTLSADPVSLSLPDKARLSQASSLCPIPFSDMGNAARLDVRALLMRYLCSVNVVSIVACGTARNTRSLLNRLWPLLTPVMIVVDSTVDELSMAIGRVYSRGSVLRLIPSNDLQAQAIVARVSTLAEQCSQSTVQIFVSSNSDYVVDLRRVLQDQWRYGVGRVTARFVSSVQELESDPDRGILVCVGYFETARQVLSCGKRWRCVVLSDGCFDDRVMAVLSTSTSASDYYVSRPAFAHSDYAHDAYAAINTVWRQIYTVGPLDARPACEGSPHSGRSAHALTNAR